VDLAHPARERLLLFAGARIQLDELRGRRAAALERAHRAQVPVRDLEVERHAQARRTVRDDLLVALSAEARHLPVERVGDRVEQRGLPCAGRPEDREQAQAGEVDRLTRLERGEPLDLQAQRLHGAVASSCAAYSAANASRTAGSGGRWCLAA